MKRHTFRYKLTKQLKQFQQIVPHVLLYSVSAGKVSLSRCLARTSWYRGQGAQSTLCSN